MGAGVRSYGETHKPDHRSDQRGHTLIYFFRPATAPHEIKIGEATLGSLRERYAAHTAMGPVEIAAILRAPSGSTEKDLHRYFSEYHIERERYRYDGRLRAYVEWAQQRPWCVRELNNADAAYPAPSMWPWHQENGDESVSDDSLVPLFDAGPKQRRSLPESLSDDWQTAPLYIAAVKDVMGGIDLDPCTTNAYNDSSVGASAIFTIHDDGLRHPWHGRVWLNPPFGGQAGDWIGKLLQEHERGRATEAVYTLPTRATSNVWFDPLWSFPICISHHRPFFRHPDGTWGSAPGGHVFGYLGNRDEVFLERFREFGATGCLRPPTSSDRRALRMRSGWAEERSA